MFALRPLTIETLKRGNRQGKFMANRTKGQNQSGYRWVIVTAVAGILAIAMGQIVNGLSVFFIPLENAFGWPRAEIALINSAGLAGLAIGGMIMGSLADRFPIRNIALFGGGALGICVILASQANALWQLYVLFFLAGAFGGGSLFAPLIALVGNWFRAGAGLAIGIASAGQAVGQGGVPFGSAFLIQAFGWSGALAALGIISLAVLLPLAMLIKDPPPQPVGASGATNEEPVPLSIGTVKFWMCIAVLGCCTCMSVPLMHLVPLIQGNGIAAPDAGGVLFVMLIVAILGRVAFGKLADMIGAIPAYMTASLWQTLLVFPFTQIHSLEMFYIYAAIFGFGYAGVMTGVLTTTRALTTPSNRSGATGMILGFAFIGHALGGYQGGLFFDLTGNYTISFANAAAAGVLNLVIVGTLFLTIRRRRAVAVETTRLAARSG
jgi:MFS family permease